MDSVKITLAIGKMQEYNDHITDWEDGELDVCHQALNELKEAGSLDKGTAFDLATVLNKSWQLVEDEMGDGEVLDEAVKSLRNVVLG